MSGTHLLKHLIENDRYQEAVTLMDETDPGCDSSLSPDDAWLARLARARHAEAE